MIFTKHKLGVRAIRATKYKVAGKINSRMRTFSAEVHQSNIRVTKWHNKYKILNYIERHNSCLKLFAYQLQSYCITDLKRGGTNFWDTCFSVFTSPVAVPDTI